MKTALPADVVAFGKAATERLSALAGSSFSGPQFALSAEADIELRRATGAALDEIGAFDIDARGSLDELLAACELQRVAGALATPYPIVERQLSTDGAWLALLDPSSPLVDHFELHDLWRGTDLSGSARTLSGADAEARRKLAPFVRPVAVGEVVGSVSADDVARHLLLGSWRVLGTVESALKQVSAHVLDRHQFGKPLADFQAVRFSVADATVATRGLNELARFTAWRQDSASAEQRRADALALRIHAAETCRAVMRTCHQLLGAVGFCDEHDVSVLDRHIQSITRLPLTAERLVEQLVPCVVDDSFETLFNG